MRERKTRPRTFRPRTFIFNVLIGNHDAHAKRRIVELAKLLPATARKLQSEAGHSFAGNAVVEQINALIEQRCALTILRLTHPAEKMTAEMTADYIRTRRGDIVKSKSKK